MLKKSDFFKKYAITDSQLKEGGLIWEDLVKIYDKYLLIYPSLEIPANYIVGSLKNIPEAHAIKSRIKDPHHLIEKIIRISEEDKGPYATPTTYTQKVKDLIGVRVIHRFKDEWKNIHKAIKSQFDLAEEPKAYVSSLDPQKIISDFKKSGFKIMDKKAGYRSLHYVVILPINRHAFKAEIQTRTLYEEAWGEIDHMVRYPYEDNDVTLTGIFSIAASVSGLADALGSYAKLTKETIELEKVGTTDANRKLLITAQKLEYASKNLKPLVADVNNKLGYISN
jgi:putative GTP pyrophosphokinase